MDLMVLFRISKCISGKNFRALAHTSNEISWKYLKQEIDKYLENQ
jgi:hypothetical protein